MSVSPADVKKLRDKTGAGMLDCKKALQACDGDQEAAVTYLRKQGLANADNRSDRATNEGSIFIEITDSLAAMIELTCETDFVAKNEVFADAGKKIVKAVAEKKLAEVNAELEEMVKEAISVLKENMTLKRIALLEIGANDMVTSYIHSGGSIGVLVKATVEKPEMKDNAEVQDVMFNLALHAAAYSPLFLNPETVDEKYLKTQEDVFVDQAKKLGKPDNVVAGIVKGKINKHFSQVCFTEQAYVKDDKQSVKQVLAGTGKAAGGSIKLVDFVYFKVGDEA